jgi:hypothetical protein
MIPNSRFQIPNPEMQNADPKIERMLSADPKNGGMLNADPEEWENAECRAKD